MHLFQMGWNHQPVLRFNFESNPQQPDLVVERATTHRKKMEQSKSCASRIQFFLRSCIVGTSKPETTWEHPINDLRILLPIALRRRRPWQRTDERGDERVVCSIAKNPYRPYPFPRIGLRVAIPYEKSRILCVILCCRDIPGFLGFLKNPTTVQQSINIAVGLDQGGAENAKFRFTFESRPFKSNLRLVGPQMAL